jgi:hypothetical protein
MRLRLTAMALACATLPLVGAGPVTTPDGLPASALAIRSGNQWVTFWRSEEARTTWLPDFRVITAVQWMRGTAGVMWAELALQGSGEAWRTKVVLTRVDLDSVRLELANGVAPGGYDAAWNIESAPARAAVALNAGQFAGGAVWGWVVHDGVEYRPPGQGPLAVAVVVDSAGRLWFTRDYSTTGVVEAFQSFPVLLENGEVPELLRSAGPNMDYGHRDARLALGQLPDGSLIIALTRFDALGDALGSVPFGFTIPEMAALMGALGCRDAVALDGGVSAQLLVRDWSGKAHTWRGLRRVPLALVALPR